MIQANSLDKAAMETLVKVLVDVYKPNAVYLYGSQAWGTNDIDSDIDMFILLKSSNINQAERIRIGTRALMGSGLDVDLLVLTEAEVLNRKNHPSTLVHRIFSKGIKLYDAAA